MIPSQQTASLILIFSSSLQCREEPYPGDTQNIKQLEWARTNWMLDMRKLLGFSIGFQIFLTPSNKGIAKGIQLYNTAGGGPCKFYCLFTLSKLQNSLVKRTKWKPQRSFFLIKRKHESTKFHLPC